MTIVPMRAAESVNGATAETIVPSNASDCFVFNSFEQMVNSRRHYAPQTLERYLVGAGCNTYQR